MDTLLAFVNTAFKARFAYRSAVFFGSLMSFVYMIVQIALWRFVFSKDPTMVKYMTAYVVLSQLLRHAYATEIAMMIEQKVISGDFVTDLIKPVNSVLVYWSTSLGGTLANIATRGLPVLVIFSPVLLNVELGLGKILLFCGVYVAGYILVNLIFTLVGYLAFLATEVFHFRRTMDNTLSFLSGAIIPIAFFPSWLASITKLLPFHLLYSFPIRILLEDLPVKEIVENALLLGAWIVFLLVLLSIVSKRAIWRSVVQGG